MKDIPGAALIAREIDIDFMKCSIKQTDMNFGTSKRPYLYMLREGRAEILLPVPIEVKNRILENTARKTENLEINMKPPRGGVVLFRCYNASEIFQIVLTISCLFKINSTVE